MQSRLARAVLALAAAAVSLSAAPPLTTIRDTIFKADGTRFSGTIQIEWRSFEASDTSFIGKQRLSISIVDGFLNVRLVPTTTAASAAWYLVRYNSGGSQQFTEAWAVSPSDQPLRIRDVRIPDPLLGPSSGGGGAGNIEIGDVEGLQAELDQRIRKSLVFTTGRAAVINSEGDIEGATGELNDCVFVDGTSGACGTGGGSAVVGTFADGETPSGAVNGANTLFTLAGTPSPASSLFLYRNGLLQKRFTDFTLSGNSIQFVPAGTPQTGDLLVASYRTAGAGATVAQVLCAAVGSSTTQTTSTSLGTCILPAGLLKAGDRMNFSWDLYHDGTGTGFQYEVRWGSTTVASRTAAAAVVYGTGRASIGVSTSDAVWSSQTWGSALSISVDAGTAVENLANTITIDFRANMSGLTSETVALRNFTVTRHPAP